MYEPLQKIQSSVNAPTGNIYNSTILFTYLFDRLFFINQPPLLTHVTNKSHYELSWRRRYQGRVGENLGNEVVVVVPVKRLIH